jgi:hypothetical protein
MQPQQAKWSQTKGRKPGGRGAAAKDKQLGFSMFVELALSLALRLVSPCAEAVAPTCWSGSRAAPPSEEFSLCDRASYNQGRERQGGQERGAESKAGQGRGGQPFLPRGRDGSWETGWGKAGSLATFHLRRESSGEGPGNRSIRPNQSLTAPMLPPASAIHRTPPAYTVTLSGIPFPPCPPLTSSLSRRRLTVGQLLYFSRRHVKHFVSKFSEVVLQIELHFRNDISPASLIFSKRL